VMGACGLIVILIFAYTLNLGPGTAAARALAPAV